MNIVTEGMIARPNMSLQGGKEGGFRRKKRSLIFKCCVVLEVVEGG